MTTLSALTSSNAQATPPTQSQSATAKLAGDFDNFLKLLTAQLQFQDPLEPLDNNQFTQQLVSFTGVEQAIATNRNLEALIANSQSNNLSATLGYLGREVEVNGATQRIGNEGTLTWNLNLATASDKAKIEVVDRNGVVVFNATNRIEAGATRFVWDGLNSNGNRVLPGDYTLRVDAKTASGTAISPNIGFSGVVGSIDVANGNAQLSVGNSLVNAGQIKRLTLPPVAPPAPNPTPSA